MFIPCLEKLPSEIVQELKTAGLNKESLIAEYERLWIDMNGIANYSALFEEESYKKCEFDRFNSGKNVDAVKDLVGEIRKGNIPLGVYSNEGTWDSKFGNSDSIYRQFGDDIRLWVKST